MNLENKWQKVQMISTNKQNLYHIAIRSDPKNPHSTSTYEYEKAHCIHRNEKHRDKVCNTLYPLLETLYN